MEQLLSHLPRLTFHPREVRNGDNKPRWRRIFQEDTLETMLPTEVTIAGAWFRGDLDAKNFRPDQRIEYRHVPMIRIRARFNLPFRPDVVDAWRDERGELDTARFVDWDEREAGLVYCMDWDLGAALREALPNVLFFLVGFRTTLA